MLGATDRKALGRVSSAYGQRPDSQTAMGDYRSRRLRHARPAAAAYQLSFASISRCRERRCSRSCAKR